MLQNSTKYAKLSIVYVSLAAILRVCCLQVHLRKKQRNQAFVCFTKAFACSVHCVHVVQEGIPALVDAIELVENSHKDLFAHLGKPPVL